MAGLQALLAHPGKTLLLRTHMFRVAGPTRCSAPSTRKPHSGCIWPM